VVEKDGLLQRLLDDNLLEKLSPHGDFELVEKIFLNAFDEPVDDLTKAQVYMVLCNTKWRQSDFDTALDYAHKALKIGENYKEDQILFEVYYHIGTIKSILGDITSLDDLMEAYKKKQSAKTAFYIGKLCNNIGMMYREMGQSDLAINYLNEAYDYFILDEKYYNLCICCQAFMVIFNELGLANKSLYYGELGKEFARKSHYKHGHNNILLYELDALTQLGKRVDEEHLSLVEKVMKQEHVDYYTLEPLLNYLSRVNSDRIEALKAMYFDQAPQFIQAIFYSHLNIGKANEIFTSLGYEGRIRRD